MVEIYQLEQIQRPDEETLFNMNYDFEIRAFFSQFYETNKNFSFVSSLCRRPMSGYGLIGEIVRVC